MHGRGAARGRRCGGSRSSQRGVKGAVKKAREAIAGKQDKRRRSSRPKQRSKSAPKKDK